MHRAERSSCSPDHGGGGFKLKEAYGWLPSAPVGSGGGDWILLDYLDFIVHIFTPEAREFYRLDVLWKQAPAESIE